MSIDLNDRSSIQSGESDFPLTVAVYREAHKASPPLTHSVLTAISFRDKALNSKVMTDFLLVLTSRTNLCPHVHHEGKMFRHSDNFVVIKILGLFDYLSLYGIHCDIDYLCACKI